MVMGECLAALSVVLAGCFGEESAESSWTRVGDWIEVLPLTENAFVVHEYRHWAANSLLVQMDDGSLLLCDTPSHTSATRELLDWVLETFARPLDAAINSHYHADAAGGNSLLIEEGIRVYGSEASAEALGEGGAAMRKLLVESFEERPEIADAFRDTSFQPATHLLPDGEESVLTFGKERVRILDPGPGHSPDNIVTYFPSKKILFGGCLVRSENWIGNLQDADLEHWPEAMRSLESLDLLHVIPGHGKRYSDDLISLTFDLASRERESARAVKAE